MAKETQPPRQKKKTCKSASTSQHETIGVGDAMSSGEPLAPTRVEERAFDSVPSAIDIIDGSQETDLCERYVYHDALSVGGRGDDTPL